MSPIRKRLDRILEAQRWGGPSGCTLSQPSPAYICGFFWLAEVDLSSIRPELGSGDDLPDGCAGLYEGIPVFPAAARSSGEYPWGRYKGVCFAYLPCLAVD